MPDKRSRNIMQTLDVGQFKELISRTGWTHESETTIHTREDGITYGFGTVTSKLSGYEITAYEGFVFNSSDVSTLDSGSEGIDEPFEFSGFEVFNEHGNKIDRNSIYDLIGWSFYTVDYSELKKKFEKPL
jgi:hypothetical protein